ARAVETRRTEEGLCADRLQHLLPLPTTLRVALEQVQMRGAARARRSARHRERVAIAAHGETAAEVVDAASAGRRQLDDAAQQRIQQRLLVAVDALAGVVAAAHAH